MKVIPAIDIIDGKCVRLLRGDFKQQKSYAASPLEQAKAIEDTGITHLHLVDLDGAKLGKPQNLNILKVIASNTSLAIDFGGGIRSYSDIEDALNAGALQVNTGTFLFSGDDIAKKCIERFGKDSLIAAIDINNGKVAVNGWQTRINIGSYEAINKLIHAGWETVSITDINRDGTMKGPDPDFYKPFIADFPQVKFVGGGGIASLAHLKVLDECGLYAAITGKAIFEGSISLNEIARYYYK